MNNLSPNIGLILGHQTSIEVQSVYKEVIRQGYIPVIVDTRDIPNRFNIEFHVNQQLMNLSINKQLFSMSQVAGVYWANVESPKVRDENRNDSEFLAKVITDPNVESACQLQMLFSMENVNWVNSFKAIQFHRTKPMQLKQASRLGALIPATYIGNNIVSIENFLSQHPQSIVKPIFAGGHTRIVCPSQVTADKIKSWATQPITLQAFIPGVNIRTYIVGQFMISGRIEEEYLGAKPKDITDYREANSIKLIAVQIPIQVQQLAVRIMRAFHMKYTAIDWRLTQQGEYVFLEANPAPLFVNAQGQMDVDLSRAIVDLMFS